jgi:hypothetical protein
MRKFKLFAILLIFVFFKFSFAKIDTKLIVENAEGIYGGSVNLSAQLLDKDNNPLSSKILKFYFGYDLINSTSTSEDGWARLENVPLAYPDGTRLSAMDAIYSRFIRVIFEGDTNYNLSTSSANLIVKRKSISVSNISAYNKIYDGTTTAFLNFSSSSIEGIIQGDEVYISTSSYQARFIDKNAQENKQVNILNLELSGLDSNNYEITILPTTTASIFKKSISVSNISAYNKIYDGTTTAFLNFSSSSIEGIIQGDEVYISTSSYQARFIDKNAQENKQVNILNLELSGLDAQNYFINSYPSTSSASIFPKEVSLEGIKVLDKIYDGTVAAQIDFSNAKIKGIIEGDDVRLDFSEANFFFEDSLKGYNKKVLIKNLKLDGRDKQNYYIPETIVVYGNILSSYSHVGGSSFYTSSSNQGNYLDFKNNSDYNLKIILLLLILLLLK